MSTRPTWTLSEAAEHVDASRSTLRRRLDAGAFPNAYRGTDGVWRVGIDDLLAAGFTMKKTWLTERAHPVSTDTASDTAHPVQGNENMEFTERAQLENELAHERAHTLHLQTQLDAEKQLRAAAERNADDLRHSLRMLDAAPKAAAPTPVPRRRRWFNR